MKTQQNCAVAALIAMSLVWQAPAANAEVNIDAFVESIEAESDINQLARLYLDISIRIDPPFGGQLGIHGTPENPHAYDDHLGDVSADGLVVVGSGVDDDAQGAGFYFECSTRPTRHKRVPSACQRAEWAPSQGAACDRQSGSSRA